MFSLKIDEWKIVIGGKICGLQIIGGVGEWPIPAAC